MAVKKEYDATDKPGSKDEYYEIKRRLIDFEMTNCTKIAVITDTNGMHKAIGNSAIILVCMISKKLGIFGYRLTDDTDYQVQTCEPICLIPNFLELEKILTGKGEMEETKNPSGRYVFTIGYRVDEADILAARKENELLVERANRLVMPKERYPKLRVELERTARMVYEMTHKMDGDVRGMIGNKMAERAIEMHVEFIEAANGHIGMRKYLLRTREGLSSLSSEVLTVMNLRLIDVEKAERLLEQISFAQKRLAGALENEQPKAGKEKNENEGGNKS